METIYKEIHASESRKKLDKRTVLKLTQVDGKSILR